MRDHLIQATYLVSGILFVLALKWLSAPVTARRGVLAGEVGMLLAIIGTLLSAEIVSFEWIVIALFAGSAVGVPLAVFMPMTAMPQRTALSHAFGALAAGLVGASEFYLHSPSIDRVTMAAIGAEVLLGFLTFTGSLMAFAKLQEIIRGRPIVYPGQNVANLSLLGVAIALAVLLVVQP
ncbi:MAG TPA: NAD(P)(+) transhydrogenase (Re/Si-specific) subunit beta, partial [Candidatus Sulfotelmatobacter sp.]|nr:NAD(P)(+) transhydrogenase (Re/Si-specific) subunit beta [Candidatus Sulfotelmatobacter sp.]